MKINIKKFCSVCDALLWANNCQQVGSIICAWEELKCVFVVQYVAPELTDLERALQQQLFEDAREVEV